jgi:SAM-dependent methyltransferase
MAVNTAEAIAYTGADELWKSFDKMLLELAGESESVAELGGGANPILAGQSWRAVPHRVVIDISAHELALGTGDFDKRVADLCRPIEDGLESYDLVFSKMLCEHLPDARTFHENCFRLLKPGGRAVHFFPTLFTLPYLANLLIPEDFARAVLRRIQPGRIDDPKHEKFPAYYRWCTGPTKRALRRYESIGFEVEAFNAAFGHRYYAMVPPLEAAEQAKTRWLLRHPVPWWTSFATVVLRKPGGRGTKN